MIKVPEISLDQIAAEMKQAAEDNPWSPLDGVMIPDACRRDIPYRGTTFRLQLTLTTLPTGRRGLHLSVGDRNGKMMSEETAQEFKRAFFGEEHAKDARIRNLPSGWQHVLQWVQLDY